MKKYFLLTLAIVCFVAGTNAQKKPVSWSFSAKKIADKTFEVQMSANIGGDYHMYAQNAGVDGPIPTTFTFTKNPLVTLVGNVKEEGKMVKKKEEVWEGIVNYYEKTVNFVQVVKVKGNAKTNVAGKVEFMVCNDEECLPPTTLEFTVNIGG